MRIHFLALLLVLSPFAFVFGADDPEPITPEEAAKKVNESVVMKIEVKSATLRNDVCFLNSEADFKSSKNFTVFLGRDALAKFKAAKIEDPAAHFKGKTIKVTGKVTLHKEKPQIDVDKPDQIEVVEKTSTEK